MSITLSFLLTLLLFQVIPFLALYFGVNRKKVGIVGNFSSQNLPLFIQNQLSMGLTKLSMDGNAVSAAASSWDIAPDNTTYTVHLKKDLKWHDGTSFTAQNVSIRLGGIDVSIVDNSTVRIRLKETYAPLPVLLSQPLFKDAFIGLGSYKLVRLVQSEDVISELDIQSLDGSYPDISYKFYPTFEDAILAFKLGEIDILKDIPKIGEIKSWKNVNISESVQYDRIMTVFINLKNEKFKDKEIRQALAYAIPKNEDEERSLTPISPLSWAYSKKIRLYTFDPETAKSILSKSSLRNSEDPVILSTLPQYIQKAEFIARSWENVGVKVRVKVETGIPPDFQMFLGNLPIPPDPDQYQYWQSTQENTNITGYNNPKIDKLLEDGRKTLNQESRKLIYASFQLYIVDDLPAIFLYFPKVYTIERK